MIFVNYPGHFVAGLLLITFAVLMIFAFRTKKLRKQSATRTSQLWNLRAKLAVPLLALLQYVAIVILLLILWNPSRPQTSRSTARNSVIILFDTSQSMSVVEDNPMTRLDKAVDVFEKKFHPSDPEGPYYKIYGFDRQFYFADGVKSLRKWGQQTNMHSVLALLNSLRMQQNAQYVVHSTHYRQQQSDRAGKVVGAVVFTDGQVDDRNVNAYLPLRDRKLQVALIGVGSKKPQCDVAIKSINAPAQVAIDSAYCVKVVVTARSLSDKPVTLELLRDGYVMAVRQLSADTLDPAVTAEFTVGADRLGTHTVSARAKTAGEELNLANNTRGTTVKVVENTRLKVLLYSQVANFNIGKVRQALARDKKIQLDLGLDVITTPALSERAGKMCGYVKLPADRAGFYKYDVIVLGPCAVDSLTSVQIDSLYSFVVDRGGGLILLPGKAEYSPLNWKNEKAGALVPVFYKTDTHIISIPRRRRVKVTLEGLDSKVINQQDFKDYARLASAYYQNIDKKPAATTFATAGNIPIVTVHRVGRGRVCLLNVSKLFRWYREDLEGGLLQKIMSGLTAYTGRVTNLEAAVELFAERLTGRTNKVRFDAYVSDESFAPVGGATVLLNVAGEVLRMDQVESGHYIAEIENFADEAVIATVQAEADGVFLGEKTTAVSLPLPRSEMDDVELDARFLQALAGRLGGSYFDADDVDENVAKMFEATTSVTSLSHMASVWPKWSLLLLLCGLLSINWFIRRAMGLV